jgi:hypothetical protein
VNPPVIYAEVPKRERVSREDLMAWWERTGRTLESGSSWPDWLLRSRGCAAAVWRNGWDIRSANGRKLFSVAGYMPCHNSVNAGETLCPAHGGRKRGEQ